jgi:hypothetical protein
MATRAPDFFMSTAGETEALANPRACWVKSRLRNQVHDGHMLIEVEPSLIGQRYDLGSRDITNLILSPKWVSLSLFPVTQWPCPVYVARILDDAITESGAFTPSQVELIAWGSIFRTLEEASAHAKRFDPNYGSPVYEPVPARENR